MDLHQPARALLAVVSGTKDWRPALDALMDDAKKRLFDGVVCWQFARFARSTKHLISSVDEFQHFGIDSISYQENIDTRSPLGKAMFTIGAANQIFYGQFPATRYPASSASAVLLNATLLCGATWL